MISQSYAGIKSIDVRSSANVTVHKGDSFQLKIAGDDAEKVKVSQSGDELTIEYKGDSGDGSYTVFNNIVSGNFNVGSIRQNGTVISGSGNVISGVDDATIFTSGGKQVRIVGGEVFINGMRVDAGESVPVDKKYIPVEIEIWCPDGLAIDCTLSGIAFLNAAPQFDCARVVIDGSCSAKLQAKSLRLNVSGSGEIECKSLGGTLNVKVSGSGDIAVNGEFLDIEVSVSGSGKVETSGKVSGNYEADVSGMGNVTHRGTIAGRKRKLISGMGSVTW